VKLRTTKYWTILALGMAAAPLGCDADSDDPAGPSGAATQPNDPPSGTSTPPSPDAVTAVASALTDAVARGDAPGVVALVVDRGGVLFEATAGQLNVASGEPMRSDGIFTIASMTKPVTSVAVMMLYEQGLLGLDDPVSKFLPGFDQLEVLSSVDLETAQFETVPATNAMTLRHLLSHTSGIGYAFANATVAALQQTNPGPEWELPLLNEPGAVWHYSASTRVLGMIVEAISGQSLEAFFQANILEPLAMNDTSFAVPAEKQARLPTLHVRGADGSLQESPQGNVPATPTPPFQGDGGLYSTARDYGRFMRMLLNGGTLDGAHILDEGTVAMMGENQIGDIFVEEQVSTDPGLSRNFPLGAGRDKFGLGFQITSAESAVVGQRSPGSLAWAGLFNTEFWIDPREGIAATLLMQVLPFYDEGALHALGEFEAAVYRDLAPARVNVP
jgi:methyl acetate hydrolase